MTDLNQLISFIIVTDRSLDAEQCKSFSGHNVYSCSLKKFENGKNGFTKFAKDKTKWTTALQSDIKTPWVMLLEEDEFLTATEKKKLFDHLIQKNDACTYVNVERYLACDEIKEYAWEKTRLLFDNPPEDIRRYFTSELRVIPTNRLNKIDLLKHPDNGFESNCSFLIDIKQQNTVFSNINISRESRTMPSEEIKMPADHDIFKYGHLKYYDDRTYRRFFFPNPITYHTIRLDHVPSIIQALIEGLSTPKIVYYVLRYLFAFGKLDMAAEILRLIPKEWPRRHAGLICAISAIQFAIGKHDEAIETLKRGRKIFPDVSSIANDAVKMHMLLGKYDMVESIENEYRKTTGNPLNTAFFQHFKTVHKGFPEKTASVSLCMIINNEAKYLDRALKSVQEIVDEIIIVDTGSTDDSVSIAKKYGANVFYMPWSDDFSAARNYAIEKATCDYIFMMDADEYISPRYFLESQIFMKFLSTDSPCAFKFFIGHYFNVADWLSILYESTNFIPENTSIRVFPKITGVKYKGLIEETVEEALMEKKIPVYLIQDTLNILHDADNRLERINRKIPIYKKLEKPELVHIIAAIKDFSAIGHFVETLHWLRKYHDLCTLSDPINLPISIRTAKFLETTNPQEAESFYDKLLVHYPQDFRLLMNYAFFLLKTNQINKIQNLQFQLSYEYSNLNEKDRLDYICLTSLKFFEAGDLEKAIKLLSVVLKEFPACLFAQSLKFNYLIRTNHISGAIQALSDLFMLLSIPRVGKIESIKELVIIVENLCENLHEKGYFKEKNIIIYGTLSLEKLCGAI